MNLEKMDEEGIRAAAKERKIRNYHNKRIERLKNEIREYDAELGQWSAPDNSLPHLSWAQVLDCLDQYAMKNLADCIEALDLLSKPYANNFVAWFTDYIQIARSGSVEVKKLYEGYHLRFGGMSEGYFENLLERVCEVYVGRGFNIEDGVFNFKAVSFPLEYHVEMWKMTKKLHNTSFATRILSVLMGENDDKA